MSIPGGRKNSSKSFNIRGKRKTANKVHFVVYDLKTMKTDDCLEDLQEELEVIQCDFIDGYDIRLKKIKSPTFPISK